MGAGILPIAYNSFTIFYLLGKEQNNEWSDFGGSPNFKYESRFHTAIREGYEETNGFLGNKFELGKKVKNNLLGSYSNQRYTTYIFQQEYDELLPKYYNQNYNFVNENYPLIIKDKNGLYEKKEIGWFSKDEIYELELRPFYKNIIYPILNQENEYIKIIENKI